MDEKVGPEVWLIRHGVTEWSRDGRHTSRTDVPLTERGREQAQLVGERLRSRRFVRVLTSPLSRALDTCVLAGFGDRAEIRPELREWDYGSYEGIRTADIWTQRPGPLFVASRSPPGAPGATVLDPKRVGTSSGRSSAALGTIAGTPTPESCSRTCSR